MWVDFATEHNPTPSSNTWTPYQSQSPEYLEIGGKYLQDNSAVENNILLSAGTEGCRMRYPESHRRRVEQWTEIYQKVPPTMRHSNSPTWSQYEQVTK